MIHPTGAIGRFKILRLLGKGNQSEVYLAHDPHLDREMEIRTLSFAFSAEHEGHPSQRNEIVILLVESATQSSDIGYQTKFIALQFLEEKNKCNFYDLTFFQ